MRKSSIRIRGTSAANNPSVKYASNDVSLEMVNEESDQEPFIIAIETSPEFIGGLEKLKVFIQNNLRYSETLRNMQISGVVYVSLIIDKDGSIKEINMLHGLHPDANKEALRVIRLTDKKWKPGELNGEKVAAEIIIPVKFSLK